MKKLIGIIVLIVLISSTASGQTVTERRYSSELESGDKFTFDVNVYTRAGNDVTTESNHFGKIVADSRVEITATKDPSSVNLLGKKQSEQMIDIFKIEVDNKRLSETTSIGIIYFFIMPTQVILDDESTKNYVNKYFSDLNADITTDSDKDTFNIELKGIQLLFDTEPVNITTWNLVYQRDSGILQSMDLNGKHAVDADSLELQVEYKKGFFARLLPFPFWSFVPIFVVMVVLRRQAKY